MEEKHKEKSHGGKEPRVKTKLDSTRGEVSELGQIMAENMQVRIIFCYCAAIFRKFTTTNFFVWFFLHIFLAIK